MPYPPEHREQTRKNIVRIARKLFNRHGLNGVSIDDIMAEAGLTRGGFYSYFQSKAELYSEAVRLICTENPIETYEGVEVDIDSDEVAPQIVRSYLSRQHFEDIDGSCPMVALSSDISRAEMAVKEAYETVFKTMAAHFDQGLAHDRTPDGDRALAIAALCVGGMVIARSLEDRTLADKVRDAAMGAALELGGWRATQRGG